MNFRLALTALIFQILTSYTITMPRAASEDSSSVSCEDSNQLFPFSNRARILFFLKRKEGTSRQEFSQYWRGSHAQIFLSLKIVQEYAITYQQLHVNTDVKAPSLLNLPFEDAWDGIVLLDAKTYDDIFTVFNSNEYKKLVEPDNDNFVDMAKAKMVLIGTVPLIENSTQLHA